MTLIIHIICSVLSLALHGTWFGVSVQQKTAPTWLRNTTLGTLGVAVVSGLLLSDGTAQSVAHSAGMLSLFLLFHAAIFTARRAAVDQR